jgi:hypothetical protein
VCAAESADELAQPGTGRVDELVMAALTVKSGREHHAALRLLRGACGPAMIFAPRPLTVSFRGRAVVTGASSGFARVSSAAQYAADQVALVRLKSQLDLE